MNIWLLPLLLHPEATIPTKELQYFCPKLRSRCLLFRTQSLFSSDFSPDILVTANNTLRRERLLGGLAEEVDFWTRISLLFVSHHDGGVRNSSVDCAHSEIGLDLCSNYFAGLFSGGYVQDLTASFVYPDDPINLWIRHLFPLKP